MPNNGQIKYPVYQIYLSDPNIKFWLELSGLSEGCYCVWDDLDAWLNSETVLRIAIHEEVSFDPENARLIETFIANSKLVIIFLPELVKDQWCRQFDHENVVFFIAGRLNYRKPKKARVLRHNYFFWSTVDFYRSHPEVLTTLSHDLPKPKDFDILMGRKKRHRDLVWETVDRSNSVVTYFHEDSEQDLTRCPPSYFQWPQEIVGHMPINNTADIVTVDGTIVSLSQLVPVDIYNQTAYSLVCESQFENRWSFFTEKIIKPMLARRVFLVCSGRYFLRNLREWGFKTFDGIVDESYDAEYELGRRVEKLSNSMKKLCVQDQAAVYKQARPIIEHNYQLLMTKPWLQDMCKELGSIIYQQCSTNPSSS